MHKKKVNICFMLFCFFLSLKGKFIKVDIVFFMRLYSVARILEWLKAFGTKISNKKDNRDKLKTGKKFRFLNQNSKTSYKETCTAKKSNMKRGVMEPTTRLENKSITPVRGLLVLTPSRILIIAILLKRIKTQNYVKIVKTLPLRVLFFSGD